MPPQINDSVHYVAFGTRDGEYPSVCRAAMVTEVGQWVTVQTMTPESYSESEGRPIRTLEQWFFDDAVSLFVMNPTGVFFNGGGLVACKHAVPDPVDLTAPRQGGTWHTAEECVRARG